MQDTKTYLSRIQKASNLNLLVQIADNFGLAFAEYYFKLHGVSLYKLILIYAISPLVSLPIVAFCSSWNIQRFMCYGLLGYIGMCLSLLLYGHYSWLMFGIFNGLNLGFFWVSFNYVFFLKSSATNNAKDSSIYFILGPLAGIILPPLGAILISGAGYRVVFFISLLLFLLPLAYTRKNEFSARTNQNFSKIRRSSKGLRTIFAYDSALHYFQGSFLAMYALFFFKSPYEVGGMFSYLAVASLIASFAVAQISDKSKKRVEILYPLLTVMAILIMVIPNLKSLSLLVIVGGVYAILDNMSLPIRFAVPMDLAKPDIGFWRASEFYGNIGRTIVFGAASLLLFVGSKWLAFGIFAVMTFTFPFVMSYKSKLLRSQL